MNKKEDLVSYWKKEKIITDSNIIEAFNNIPREDFVSEEFKEKAYEDNPIPIGFEQTISQPTTMAIMTQALELKPGLKVLEIGTGSGYQSSILAHLVKPRGKVHTLEIIPELIEKAKLNLKDNKNINIIKLDGSRGYKEAGPYDRIIQTAASPKISRAIVNQLKDGGIFVGPIGHLYNQKMLKVTKNNSKLETKNLGNFIFVPLKGENGF